MKREHDKIRNFYGKTSKNEKIYYNGQKNQDIKTYEKKRLKD
jgi:hypothetical protein